MTNYYYSTKYLKVGLESAKNVHKYSQVGIKMFIKRNRFMNTLTLNGIQIRKKKSLNENETHSVIYVLIL